MDSLCLRMENTMVEDLSRVQMPILMMVDGCLFDFRCKETSNSSIGKEISRRKSPSI